MEIAEKICLPSHHSPHHPSMLSSLPASQPPCPHRPVILTDQVWIIDALSSLPTSLRSLFPSLFSAALHGLTLREAALLSHINLPSQVCGAQQWGRGEGWGDEGVAFGVDCRHTAQVFSLFFFCAHCEQHVAQSDADFEPISAGKKQEEVLLVKKNFEGNNVADFSMFKVRHGGCHWYLDNFLLVDLCLFSCASSRFLQHVYNLFVCWI